MGTNVSKNTSETYYPAAGRDRTAFEWHLLVAITDNVNTDLFLIAADGSTGGISKSLSGRFIIAQGEEAAVVTLLYGVVFDNGVGTTKLIMMDDQLAELSVSNGEVGNRFTAQSIYSLESGALIGFGSDRKPIVGGYEATIAVIQRDLKSQDPHVLNAAAGRVGPFILAAAAASTRGDFVSVTTYGQPGSRGLALHFVSIR